MRIATITTSYPRHQEDFAGLFVADLNSALRDLGHEVLTLAPEAPGFPTQEENANGSLRRIRYTHVPEEADLFYGHGLERNIRSIKQPLRKLKQWQRAVSAELSTEGDKLDLVIAHWLYPSLVTARSWRRSTGKPLLGIGHGGDLHLLARPIIGRWISRGIKGLADGILCTHDEGAATVVHRGLITSDRVKVLAMGTDPKRFHRAHELAKTEPKPSSFILGVGRLDRIKGFDILIQSLAQLPSPGTPLVLIGDGPERAALLDLAQSLKVEVDFRGTQGPSQVALAMVQASLLVVPSRVGAKGRSEGTPVTAVEGVVAQVPILASATGGLPRLLPDHCLFAVEDANRLSKLIDAALSSGGDSARVHPAPNGLSSIEVAKALLSLLTKAP